MSPVVSLPDPLPVFPLTGVILLPGNLLPLHVFEPRYRNMVEDALAGDRHIGMIQPRQPLEDNAGPPPEQAEDRPELYAIGGAGRLVRCEKTDQDTYVVVLQGVSRFRVREELPIHRGYRRVRIDPAAFPDDGIDGDFPVDAESLLERLATLDIDLGLEIDPSEIDQVPGGALLNSLAAALPLHPAEKQALLEASDTSARYQLLLSLLEMGIAEPEAN